MAESVQKEMETDTTSASLIDAPHLPKTSMWGTQALLEPVDTVPWRETAPVLPCGNTLRALWISSPTRYLLASPPVFNGLIVTYGSLTCSSAANSHIRRLETLQKCISRLITSAPWFVRNQQLCNDLGIPTLQGFAEQLSRKTLERIRKTLERIERVENSLVHWLTRLHPDRSPPLVPVRRPINRD
ncbi:hypothetical protein QE152_g6629 [Popillia japonica]|uniref:Uncharacterized protein n=1 Tax=Popillia japonica TaxID=7064 RepID=A0AAW1MI84_POPJA